MRIFKRLLACIVALAFLAGLNAAITFAIEPFGSKSELAWTDYSAEENIDTVIVGTSLAQNAIDPQLLDELCGSNSFCLATPSQLLEESFVAIQTAYEDHGIKRAILGVSSVDLQASDPPSPGDAFLYHRSLAVGPARSAQAAWQMLVRYGGIRNSDSINALFPWFYNHVQLTPSSIADNVRARLNGDLYEAAKVADPIGSYAGKGHVVYDTVLDYDEDSLPFFTDDREDAATDTAVNPDRMQTVKDIRDYCADKGIELIVIETPLPVYNVVDGDGYYELSVNVSNAFADLGLKCYDFNFARPELFEPQPDYFLDTIHLNAEGSRAFTESFADFLRKLESGEDVSGLFLSADEQRASVDYISAVFAESSVDEAGVHVEARAATGSNVEVEYQLCAFDGETQVWQVVADWSASPSFDYAPGKRGVVNLRVKARVAGSQSDGDRYRNLNVYY